MYHLASSLNEYLNPPKSNLNNYLNEDDLFSEFFYNVKYALYKIKILFSPENKDELKVQT